MLSFFCGKARGTAGRSRPMMFDAVVLVDDSGGVAACVPSALPEDLDAGQVATLCCAAPVRFAVVSGKDRRRFAFCRRFARLGPLGAVVCRAHVGDLVLHVQLYPSRTPSITLRTTTTFFYTTSTRRLVHWYR